MSSRSRAGTGPDRPIAAVPIRHAVDLQGLEEGRDAGGGHQVIGRELLPAEDRNLAVRALVALMKILTSVEARRIEVDKCVDRVPQRIDVERVRLVRTEASGDHVRPGLVAPGARTWSRSPRWIGEGTRRRSPCARRLELAARPVDPPLSQPSHHDDGIHGAGARAADRFYGEASVFENGIEHTPREGAVGSAAREGEGDWSFGACAARRGGFALTLSKATRHRAISAEASVRNHALVDAAS